MVLVLPTCIILYKFHYITFASRNSIHSLRSGTCGSVFANLGILSMYAIQVITRLGLHLTSDRKITSFPLFTLEEFYQKMKNEIKSNFTTVCIILVQTDAK